MIIIDNYLDIMYVEYSIRLNYSLLVSKVRYNIYERVIRLKENFEQVISTLWRLESYFYSSILFFFLSLLVLFNVVL